MTATDELRAMLDERGVEWKNETAFMQGQEHLMTTWKSTNGKAVAYSEFEYPHMKKLRIYDCTPEQAVEATLGRGVTGDTSDGYHTFNELYHHRAVLFSVIVRMMPDKAWKSKLHHTGDMFDGMFIVGIDTPAGQATYHYDIDPYWEMFDCKELERAPEWDGHTPSQAIERIATLGRGACLVQEAGERIDELRELVRDLLHHIEYPPCEGCLLEMSCAGDLSQCDEYFDWLKPRARKLGVEVD